MREAIALQSRRAPTLTRGVFRVQSAVTCSRKLSRGSQLTQNPFLSF
jgi:hypothetical protein